MLPLTFSAVDNIAFAAERIGKGIAPRSTFFVKELGPLIELFHLTTDGRLPSLDSVPWLVLDRYRELFVTLRNGPDLWISSKAGTIGLLKASSSRTENSVWLRFVSAAEKATAMVGFSRQIGLQLVAAVEELVDNIAIHSGNLESGWAFFRASKGFFEFVVLDRGVGVMRSLKENAQFELLNDHGDALQIALTDGKSRYGDDTQHGHGFRPLFTGLSNLNGSLRFRTGDHALLINGQNPKNIPWKKATKPKISGFFVSVCCTNSPR